MVGGGGKWAVDGEDIGGAEEVGHGGAVSYVQGGFF